MLYLESKVLAWCRGSSEDAIKLIELMCSDSSEGIRQNHVLKVFLVEECGNHSDLGSMEMIFLTMSSSVIFLILRALISSTNTFKREYMSLTLSFRFMTKVLNFLIKP